MAASHGKPEAAAQATASGATQATAQVPAQTSDEPKAGSKPDGSPVAPIASGAYTSQSRTGSSVAAVAQSAAAAHTAAVQADAHSQSAAQQSADPKQHAGAQPVNDGRQPVGATVSAAAKPAVTATQPQPQSTSSTPSSPTPQQQTGADAHTGNGSGGHSGTPAQPNAGTAAGGTPGAAAGAQASSTTFSVAAAGATQSTSSGQQATQNLAHGLTRTSVSLQDAVDAVKATFTAANQAGVSSARISLSPESLGGIKISLSQTPDGLIARVATDHPEAAQTLQQSAADLKQSLEDSGMSLLRLDIGTSGQQSFSNFAGSTGDGSSAGSSWTGGQSSDDAEEDNTSTPTELSTELASGSLVNVLA